MSALNVFVARYHGSVPRPRSTRRRDPCYLCGGAEPNDREHVVPRSFFPSPKPSTLATLPAHASCNKRLQRDEEVFRILALVGAYGDPSGRRVWHEQIRPQLRRQEATGFRRMLAESVSPLDVYTPAGLFRGRVETLNIRRDRVEPVLEKIVRGLYCIDREVDFVEGVGFGFFHYRPESGGREVFGKIIRDLPSEPREIAPVLTYRYGAAVDDPRYSIWALFFYRRSLWIVTTEPAPVLAEIVG